MVCNRCIKVVRDELTKLNLSVLDIKLGELILSDVPTKTQIAEIRAVLEANGFELLDDRKAKIIESIKTHIIDLIHHKEGDVLSINYSNFLSDKIGLDYSYMSHLFSSVEHKTIEKYIISQKIEKVKELMRYGELSVKEIAVKLGYSSLQALSTQFKKETGMTPSDFKNLGGNSRKPLDEV